MWVFWWAGRCVNTCLPGLGMIFNNRIWSSSQHFIQALNLKVEPRDLKKFMIPQTQRIFPHDHYLRTKSVKPALCGLDCLPGSSSGLLWRPQQAAQAWVDPHPCSQPQPCPRPKEASWVIWFGYHPSPCHTALRVSAWASLDKDSVWLERITSDVHYCFLRGNQPGQSSTNLGQHIWQLMMGTCMIQGLTGGSRIGPKQLSCQ